MGPLVAVKTCHRLLEYAGPSVFLTSQSAQGEAA